MIPVPGNRTLASSATEVLDQYRENSGEFGISEGSGGSNPSVEGA
jgi:hypothetical protein